MNKSNIIIRSAIAAVIWGILMFSYDLFLSDTPINYTKSITSTFIGMVAFFLFLSLMLMLVFKITNKKRNT